jgi:hypothetical protein
MVWGEIEIGICVLKINVQNISVGNLVVLLPRKQKFSVQ